MVIEMSGYNIRCHIISWMLYRRERINILTQRKDDNTSRMLTGTSSDSGTPLYDTVNLAYSFSGISLFVIILYKSIGCFLCQGTDRSGTIGLPITENNLCILMCITLVVTGKVQVDIRLFITFKSKECLKRNIKSGFHQLLTAHRTIPVRHIHAASSGVLLHFFGSEITKVAVITIIMRTQRINLRDTCHSRYE